MPKIIAERSYNARRAIRWLSNHRLISRALVPLAGSGAAGVFAGQRMQEAYSHYDHMRNQVPTLFSMPYSVQWAVIVGAGVGAVVLTAMEVAASLAFHSEKVRNIPPNISDIKKLSKALRQVEKSFKGDDQYKQIRSELIRNLRNKDYASVLGTLKNHQAVLVKVDPELFDRAKSAAEVIHFVRGTWEKTKGMVTWPDVPFPSSAEGMIGLIREQVQIIETARGLANGNINIQEVETTAVKLYQRLISLLAKKKGREVLPTLIKSIEYTTDEDIDGALAGNLPYLEDLNLLIAVKFNERGFNKGYGAERTFLKMVRINRELEEQAVDRLRGILKDSSIETRTHIAFHVASLLDAMGRANDALPEFMEILDDKRPVEIGWIVAIKILNGVDKILDICRQSDQFRSKLIAVLENYIVRKHEGVRIERQEEKQWEIVGATPVTLVQKDERSDYTWGGDPIWDWVTHTTEKEVPYVENIYNEIAISMLRKLGVNPEAHQKTENPPI